MLRIGDAKLLDCLVQAGMSFVFAIENAADSVQRARKRRFASLAQALGQVSQLGAQHLGLLKPAPLRLHRRPVLERHELAVPRALAPRDLARPLETLRS